jgi:hypothetical protein
MMVIPAYLYKDKAMHDVVIVGEILAIASDRRRHLVRQRGRRGGPTVCGT